MKKQLLLITSLVFIATVAFGGGIVTNTNQSAYWLRTLVRDAAIGPDAVYFNPAGLTRMEDGFHFSLNTQTIFQSKDVTSDYPKLNPTPKKYLGDVKAPVFPGVYATWKKSKIAISFGFNPIGGGGGAEYKKGLPSFETGISSIDSLYLNTLLTNIDNGLSNPSAYGFDPQFSNVTGYNADIYFKGTSVFFGYQLGVTYQITDVFSAYVGARLVTAKNTYKGHVKDIGISVAPNPIGNDAGLYTVSTGDYTFGNYLRGVSEATGVTGMADAYLLGTAAVLDVQTADREVDAEESGMGFAPIIGLNISPSDKLNIGLKYEFKTKLDLETTINDGKDGGGMFVQDSTVHNDIPAMLSVGVDYKVLPKLSATVGFHYFFDKAANYGKTLDLTKEQVTNDKVMDNNYFEVGVSLEYSITDKFLVSGGYLMGHTGVTDDYQSDMGFSLNSSTIGFGFGYKITEKFLVNLGGGYTFYQDGEKELIDGSTETYYKENILLGLGLDFSF